MKQKDIKLLWGRSASRCSICKQKLAEVTNLDGLLIGEQAHIVGEKESAPRGKSNLSLKERNSYHNLILLCPNHHTLIDKDTKTYTVEKLHLLKSQHELWVEEQLASLKDSKELASEIVYAHLIDSMTELCHFNSFDQWMSMLCTPSMTIPSNVYNGLCEFRGMIFKSIMPGKKSDLERAIKALGIVIGDFLDTYGLHIKHEREFYSVYRFYKNDGFHNPNYLQDLETFNKWENRVLEICFKITRIMNWVAEVIRREINPLYFIKQGKFTITVGPDMNLNSTTYLVELSDEDKISLPDSYIKSNLDDYRRT